MGFEIMNRVLEELNREEYKTKFIAKNMDDEGMGAIVDDTSFCYIIQKIVPRRDHAIQIQNKFKELWSSKNEDESSASGRRSSAAGGSTDSGSTDSMLTHSMAVDRTPVPVPLASFAENQSIPAPGPSTHARLNEEHVQNLYRMRVPVRVTVPVPRTNQLPPQNAEEERSSGNSESESSETPVTTNDVKHKRRMPTSHLNLPARRVRKGCDCRHVHSHRLPSPVQEARGSRSSSESP